MPKDLRGESSSSEFTKEKIACRRDEVVRLMANTPPQPRTKSPARRSGMKKTTSDGRESHGADKDGA